MNLVERHISEKPGNDKEVSISSGWWDKFMERNPSLYLRCGDSTVGVSMDALIILMTILIYSRMYLKRKDLLTTLRRFIIWTKQGCS